ncbi:MAG: hypothetical protein OWR62_12020 [Sulfobacillus thermotolerans]|nr:hypothetical protein [Sulfobacillus thermotolerans]
MMGRIGWLTTDNALYRIQIQLNRISATPVLITQPYSFTASETAGAVTVAVFRNHHIFIRTSEDGGRRWITWGMVPSPYPPWQLTIQRSTGWLETSPGPAGPAMPAQLWRTTDGGHQWTLVAQAPGGIGAETSHRLPNGGQFTWTSPTTGWLIPYPKPSADQFFVYQTSSGGNRWVPIAPTWPPGRQVTQVLRVGALVPDNRHQVMVLIQWGGRRSGWQAVSWGGSHHHGWSRLLPDYANAVISTNGATRQFWIAAGTDLWTITASSRETPQTTQVTTALPWRGTLVALQLSSASGWALIITADNRPELWMTTNGGRSWHLQATQFTITRESGRDSS